MKKIILLSLFSLVALFAAAQNNTMPASLLKLLTVGNVINRCYVDEINEDEIVEEGIRSMLKKLDPHSTYTDPKETKTLLEEMQGSFGGIGIQFNMLDDTLYVIRATAGGPSARAGIKAGDRIVSVNDTAIAGVKMERSDIMSRLRGVEGTKLNVQVKRAGVPGLLPFSLVRGKIAMESVDVAYMVDKKVGYIRITSFGANTHKEFVTKLDSLKERGMKSLILDLQGNGGGYLTAAVDIANEFLERTNLVVYTEGRTSPRYEHLAQGGGRFTQGNLVVLVDETSASASEILAGAVQDWDRGIIVGRRTYGKGLVQRPFPLPDNSMVRLTIARYYTPTGRCIQKPYGDSIKYHDDLMNRYNSGELTNADSHFFPDSLKKSTLRLGRAVYGGGGIMPDYFVPLDTLRYTAYHRQLARKGSIVMTALRYVDARRAEILAAYPTVEEFDARFKPDSAFVRELRLQAGRDSIQTPTAEEFEKSLPEVTRQFRALVARDLWNTTEAMQLHNRDNDFFKKGYELIKQRNVDNLLLKKTDADKKPAKKVVKESAYKKVRKFLLGS
jgi:carboxyl-terminal processing protease